MKSPRLLGPAQARRKLPLSEYDLLDEAPAPACNARARPHAHGKDGESGEIGSRADHRRLSSYNEGTP